MLGTREATEVCPYFGQEHFCYPPIDTWDAVQALDVSGVCYQALLDLGTHAGNGVIEVVYMAQLLSKQKGMKWLEPAP